ncbi:MAG: phage head closure protein [Oscillospiraceae bacterium]
MKFNPGKLNEKIVLQKYTIFSDEIGNEMQEWQDYYTLRANVNGLYGQEYWAAAAQGQEDTITFTTRWSTILNALSKSKELTQYRIVFNDIVYEIKSYDNVEFANKIVKIKAVSK